MGRASLNSTIAAAACACVAAFALPASAGAATVATSTGVDDGTGCTLRDAVAYLNTAGGGGAGCDHTGTFGTADTIALMAGTDYALTIASTNENGNADGDLDIAVDLTIVGDETSPPSIDSQVADRVLDVVNPTSLTLRDLTVEGGTLTVDPRRGANIRYAGEDGDTLALDGVTVQDGETGGGANDRGAGIAAESGGHVLVQNGSLITGNEATGKGSFFYGGGVYIGGSGTDLTINDSTISDNEAGVANGVRPTGGAGGGILSAATGDSAIVLDNSTVSGNAAGGGPTNASEGYGGGVSLGGGGLTTASSLQVIGGSVTGNTAGGAGAGRGGGIFADGTAGAVSIEGTTVTGNEAGGNGGTGTGLGGGLYADRGVTVSDDASFTLNEAGYNTTPLGAGGNGGGISVTGTDSDLTIQDSTVSDNLAGEFTGDSGSGAGVEMIGTGTLTVSGSTISNNNAYEGSGGGIYRESSAATPDDSISGSTIAGNGSAGGGGVYIRDDNSPLAVSASTLSSNGATAGASGGGGGGIYTESDLSMTNSTVANNHAAALGGPMGGGIRTSDSASAPDLLLDHVTMAGNTTSGAGGHLFLQGEAGDATIRASILGLASAAGDPTTSACSQEVAGLIDSGGFNLELATDQCDFDSGGDLTSVSNANAALGALGDNGGPTETVALGPASLAIDRVTSGCSPPSADQRGVTRPQGIRCDSGAFELEQRTLTVSIAGTGTGTVTGTGINCPGDCSQDYPIGSQVTLTATPTSGTFTSWSGGGCTGTAPCVVTMGTDTAVSAAFTAGPTPPPPPANPNQPTKKKCKKGFKRVKVKGKFKCKRKKQSKK